MKVSYLSDIIDDELMRDKPDSPSVPPKSPRKIVIGRRKPTTVHRGGISVANSNVSLLSGLSGSCAGSIKNSLPKTLALDGNGTATPNRGPARFISVNLERNIGSIDVARQTELIMNNLKNLQKNVAVRSLSQQSRSEKENVDSTSRVQSSSPVRQRTRVPFSPVTNNVLNELRQEFSPSPVRPVAKRKSSDNIPTPEPIQIQEVPTDRIVAAQDGTTNNITAKAYVSLKRLDSTQLQMRENVDVNSLDENAALLVDNMPRPSDAFQPTPIRFNTRSETRSKSKERVEKLLDQEVQCGIVETRVKHAFKPGTSRPSEADLGFTPPKGSLSKVPSEMSEVTFNFKRPSKVQESEVQTNAGKKRKEAPNDLTLIQGECRYLQSWIPRLRNERLYVEGDLIDLDSSSLGVGHDQRWVTSKIVKRICKDRVATKGGTMYVLEGPLVVRSDDGGKMAEYGTTPNFVLDKFKDGFPENWERLVNHWIKFSEQNSINTSCMSVFNSTSATNTNMAMSNLTALSNISAISGNTSRFLNAGTRMHNPQLSINVAASLSILPEEELSETRPQFEVLSCTPKCRSRAVTSKVAKTGKGYSRSRSPLRSIEEEVFEEGVTQFERRSRSKTVRYNKNSTRKEKLKEKTAQADVMEVTMSQQDFSLLRAKNYSNTSVINKKKNYNCHFCEYMTPLFNTLKLHIKKNHLAEGNTSLRSPSHTSPRCSQSNDSILATPGPSKPRPRRNSLSLSKVDASDKNQNGKSVQNLEEQIADATMGKNDYLCRCCDVKSKSKSGIISHLKSKKHANQLSLQKRPLNTNQEESTIRSKSNEKKGRSKSNSKKSGSNSDKERASSTDAPSDSKLKEKLGKMKHTMEEDASLNPPTSNLSRKVSAPGLSTYVCFACDVSYSNDLEMFEHLMKIGHTKKVKTCKEKKYLSCNVCAMITNRKDDYIKHMRTKKHLTAVASKKGDVIIQEEEEKSVERPVKKQIIDKKSRFGRNIKKTKAMSRESCIYGTPEELAVDESTCKRGKDKKLTNVKNMKQKPQLEESPRRKVLNPFKRSEVTVPVRKPSKSSEDILRKVSVNPKTVKQRQQNAEALKEYNEDHEDDIFNEPLPSNSKSSLLKPSTKTLLTEDSDSDSEQDISLHSARTPMTTYFGKNNLRSTTPMLNQDKTPGILFPDSPIVSIDKEGFQAQAYIHKKVAEKAKDARKMRKHKLTSALVSKVVSRTQADKMVDESSQVITTITNHTAGLSQNTGDDDDEADDWFEDVQEKNLSCDPGAGLLELLAKHP